MPAKPRGWQSIQSLGNNEDVSLHFSEFRPTNDHQFLGCVCLEVSVTYICGPQVHPIKLSKESDHS